jgi:hypothetical protein
MIPMTYYCLGKAIFGSSSSSNNKSLQLVREKDEPDKEW